MNIRLADKTDYDNVRNFYYDLIDAMEEAEYKPAWEKDIYPTREFLFHSIENNEMYIGESDDNIISCMVVNHEYNEGYERVKWSVEAEKSEILVIHVLAVHVAFSRKGLAKQMVQKVIDTARENKIKTIRLDVLGGNLPAEKSYTKMGFQYVETVQMFYEDTGWTDFNLFEYIVK